MHKCGVSHGQVYGPEEKDSPAGPVLVGEHTLFPKPRMCDRVSTVWQILPGVPSSMPVVRVHVEMCLGYTGKQRHLGLVGPLGKLDREARCMVGWRVWSCMTATCMGCMVWRVGLHDKPWLQISLLQDAGSWDGARSLLQIKLCVGMWPQPLSFSRQPSASRPCLSYHVVSFLLTCSAMTSPAGLLHTS